jgi:transcriptional regulator with XRE-family HTH domain
MSDRRCELKAFLRARRAALTPPAVGLSEGSRRKTPGLRREEVAAVADVGVTWYTWLEQGREIRVSADALERIGHALRLTQSDMEYLFALAGVAHPAAASAPSVDPPFQRIVESVDRAPAIVLNPQGYVVAFNGIADRVYDFQAHGRPFGRNHLWRMFGDPERIALYAKTWDALATNAVGILRANYTSRASDAAFDELLVALRATGDEFRRRWDAHYTAPVAQTLELRLAHQKLGRLAISSTRLAFPSPPGYVLFVQPAADARTVATLDRIARRAATPSGPSNRRR